MKNLARTTLSLTLAMAAGLAFHGAATAAERAFLSGPSIARAGAEQQFNGGRFAPHQPLTVMVRAPGGAEAGYSAVASAEGMLSYSFSPDRAGTYVLRVVSAAGKPLARAQILVSE